MSWNTHAEGSHLLGCLLKNTVHVFDIEKGAVLHNFVCNNGLDIIWSGSNKNVIYSITCEGYLLRKDIREPDTGQFGEDYQQSLASKNSQIEISNNFIFVGNQEGHYNIFDLRTKNRIQHFTLQTDNFKNAVSEKDNKKGKLETLETLVNIPLFAVETENSGNKFNFCSKYSVDFLMKKLDLSQEEDKSTVNFIQTRHVDNILDFKFHPTLPILYSSGLGLDVTNCKEPITYI
uniref:Nucleolar protein 10 n=1 Tax=Rhabditophanes sp. KR3021 TaxID=114890 RepID=A0AC35TS53_9BILA